MSYNGKGSTLEKSAHKDATTTMSRLIAYEENMGRLTSLRNEHPQLLADRPTLSKNVTATLDKTRKNIEDAKPLVRARLPGSATRMLGQFYEALRTEKKYEKLKGDMESNNCKVDELIGSVEELIGSVEELIGKPEEPIRLDQFRYRTDSLDPKEELSSTDLRSLGEAMRRRPQIDPQVPGSAKPQAYGKAVSYTSPAPQGHSYNWDSNAPGDENLCEFQSLDKMT